MTNSIIFVLTFIAAIGSSLVAGIFFAFSTFVMTALGRILPEHGIAAMQSINVAVLNPWFFAAFFGTAALCVVLAIFALVGFNAPGAKYLLAGAVLYLVGTVLVTILFNVPLNNALAAAEPGSANAASLWTHYLSRWTVWNHVRTAAALAAAVSSVAALCCQARGL